MVFVGTAGVVLAAQVAGDSWRARAASAEQHDAKDASAVAAVPTRDLIAALSASGASAPRIQTGLLDPLGRTIDVSCASCHSNFEPNVAVRRSEQLVEFHQGLHFAHGEQACLTCHNASNYNTLRLADGSSLAYEDVMQLCAQCHTPQATDYVHGAHGGMTGYWDTTRGDRQRKTCVDCHDPHAPAFPQMKPTFKPHDRFLNPHAAARGELHE